MRKSVIGSVVCLLVAGFVATAALAGSRRGGGGGADEEALIGGFHCGGNQDETNAWLTFNGTGDVFDGTQYIYQPLSLASDPGERCEAAAGQMRALLGSSCKAGVLRGRSDEYGEDRDFEFVCRGSRAQIVGIIADTTGALFEGL